jgi:hypothetical protein
MADGMAVYHLHGCWLLDCSTFKFVGLLNGEIYLPEDFSFHSFSSSNLNFLSNLKLAFGFEVLSRALIDFILQVHPLNELQVWLKYLYYCSPILPRKITRNISITNKHAYYSHIFILCPKRQYHDGRIADKQPFSAGSTFTPSIPSQPTTQSRLNGNCREII